MIIHVTHLHNAPTDRHKRAYASWKKIPEIKTIHQQFYGRSSRDIGDARLLPYFKDLINYAMRHCGKLDDVILWCNDDVQLDPNIVAWCNNAVVDCGALSMRRHEPGIITTHMGRELFGFRSDWIRSRIDKIPDFIIGSPFFDLIIAAFIRKESGYNSTIENMLDDIDFCDSKCRFAIHEPHPSSWAGPNEHKYPANIYNKRLAKEWCRRNMPSLKL